MLMKSKFFHVFSELNLGWHALDFRKIELTPETKKILERKNFSEPNESELPGLSFLKEIGFLVKEGDDEIRIENLRKQLKKNQVQGLYLIVSTECNLNCFYCFYRNKNSKTLARPVRQMDEEVIKRAIDFFVTLTSKNNKQECGYWEQITFYGGEPLFNMNAIQVGVDYIDKLKVKGELWADTNLVVNTNGTLITDEFAILAAQQNLEVQVSIDGFREIHDQSRGRREGGGSFEEVINGVEVLHCHGVSVTPMITVTSNNARELPHLVEWLYENFFISKYFTNLLISTTEEDASHYPLIAARAMSEAHRAACKFGIEDNFGSTIKGFWGPQPSQQSCGAGRKITIFPNGEIHTCQALEESGVTFLGQLPEFDQNSVNWQYWQRRTRFNNNECLVCPVVGSCGGGCAAGSYNTSQDINSIDPNYCEWIKVLFKEWISKK